MARGGFRFTVNANGSRAALRQYDAQVRNGAQAVAVKWLGIQGDLTFDLCPKKTGYMSEHLIRELTEKGYGYRIGFDPLDFIGHTNPADGTEITYFYPAAQEYGTRYMAPQPCVHPAQELCQPGWLADLKSVLTPPGSR